MDHFDDHFLNDSPLDINFDEEPKFFHPEAAQEDYLNPQPAAEESIYTDNPVRVCLSEMGAVPLLTREREVDLARLVGCSLEEPSLLCGAGGSRAPVCGVRALCLSHPTGILGYSGDGGPAASAQLSGPIGVAVDWSGNLFYRGLGQQPNAE